MRGRLALATAAMVASCAPQQYPEPCRVVDDVQVASMPGATTAASGPAMDVLAQGRVRIRWWTSPDLLADGGATDAVAEMATFDGDGGQVERGQVAWPVTSIAGAYQLLSGGPPLWVDDGAAQVQTVLGAFVGPGGMQMSERSLRYAHAPSLDAGVQYDDVPTTACTNCRLDSYSQRMPSRVVTLFTQEDLYAPGSTTALSAALVLFDGGCAGDAAIPDAGPVWTSTAWLQRNASEDVLVVGPPDAPTAYDENLTPVGGPFGFAGSVASAIQLSETSAVGAWMLASGYVLVQSFTLAGAPQTFATRVTSASDVLSVGRSGALVATAVWDGQSTWAAVTDQFGRKQGGDVLIGGGPPRQVAIAAAPDGFHLWMLHANSLRQVHLTCDPSVGP